MKTQLQGDSRDNPISRADATRAQLDYASREIDKYNAELSQLRAQIAEATKILESHTDLAACEADQCGCMGCTLPELAMGAREEIERWQEKHGLVAVEANISREYNKLRNAKRGIGILRDCQRRLSKARAATDAAGALERARRTKPSDDEESVAETHQQQT